MDPVLSSRKALVLAVALPIVALVALALSKQYISSTGKTIVLPIEAYDPRDLLAGHYLIYRVDYGVEDLCLESNRAQPEGGVDHYVCLDPKSAGPERPERSEQPGSCRLYIAGRCEPGGFAAGIERFYLPQEEAMRLERELLNRKASIRVAVSSRGIAQVKALLIDGQEWNQR